MGADDDDDDEMIQVEDVRSRSKSNNNDFSWNPFAKRSGSIVERSSVNSIEDVLAKDDNSTVLDGATIKAVSTSIFQRLRLMDGIDYKQIS